MTQVQEGSAATADGLYRRIEELARQVEGQVVDWRHHLHRHPELPNREKDTARFIVDRLGSLDLDEIRTGIAGHGVVGVLKGGRPGDRVVALRADFDALPVKEASGVEYASTVVDEDYPGGPFPVAHACGHDCHTAMLLGAASVLAQVRNQLEGTVLFVFQPAEEGPPIDADGRVEPGGAQQMDDEGALADPRPSMVFGMHVAPLPKHHVGYRTGNQFGASCMIRIVVAGKQVHGSTPWEGVDPLPPAAEIITAMGQLYRQLNAFDPLTVTIGHVQDVGRFNIIGARVTLLGTIRCSVESDMDEIQRRVERTADHIAQAYGCTAEVAFPQNVPAVHNEPPWVDAALPTLRRVAGADHLVETSPTLGYDDVSVFVNKYGGLYVMLGCQDLQLTADGAIRPIEGGRGVAFNHNPAFYADDGVLATGVLLHANIAVDHLSGKITA